MNSPGAIDEIFGPNGILERAGREHRPGQLAVAHAVAQSIRESRPAMIEGPTGTGKTFAYLAPAILASLSGKRVVVAVSTNALLDQIALDIPRLAELLGSRVSFAKIKGRSHYVCQQQAEEAREQETRDALHLEERAQLDRLMAWIDAGHFDLTAYDTKPVESVRRLVTISGEECRDRRDAGTCEFLAQTDDEGRETRPLRCQFLLARAKAAKASIVVTNVDLLVMNARLNHTLLGTFDIAIVDEAHELNAKVRDIYADERGRTAFDDAASRLRDLAAASSSNEKRAAAEKAAADLEHATNALFASFASFARNHGEDPRFRDPEAPLEVVVRQRHGLTAAPLVDAALVAYRAGNDLNDAPRKEGERAKSDVRDLARRLDERLTGAENASGNYALWVEVKGKPFDARPLRVSLHGAPLDVTDALERNLHQLDGKAGKPPTVIALSATLSPDGRFEFPRSQLAMPANAITCLAPSPFDYAKSALWFTPADMPKPGTGARERELYNRAAGKYARSLALAAGGRTLVLCSATRDIPAATSALSGLGFEVLVQGTMPPAELTRRFKANPSSCLVGSNTFGTGFDVPGDALEVVVLWKLPFSKQSPVDEVLKDRLSSGGWYRGHYLPAMLLQLKQWVGRLIRAKSDRGVVAILDSQAMSARYGREVSNAMPRGIRRTQSLPEAEAFLASLREPGSGSGSAR